MNGAKLLARHPVRALIVGYPKAGKTGSLVSLLKAGYKVRMLDYDGNPEPLIQFTPPEFLKNLDIVSLRDDVIMKDTGIEAIGKPTAVLKGFDLLDHWKYTDDDGTVVDLGRSRDWGCDTVVVVDSTTTHGQAEYLRWLKLMNKGPRDSTFKVWGKAMEEQESFLRHLTRPRNHHVIVFAHLVMVAPKTIDDDEDPTNEEIKRKTAELVPTRLWPSALGSKLPQKVGGMFPMIFEAKVKFDRKGNERRVLSVLPRPELDVGAPLVLPKELNQELDIETGLAYVFERLAPPLSTCISAPSTKE